MKKSQGFTLLEILLVVGIISILAGIVIVAINPGRQLAQVRNTERQSDLKQIYNALNQYYIDYSTYPTTIPATLTEICDTGTGTTTHGIDCTDLIDLSILVPTYLVSIPKDPQGSTLSLIPKALATTNGTNYRVRKSSANKVILMATGAERGSTISIGGGIPTNGLVSFWPFDGNALDVVGENDGTIVGSLNSVAGVKGVAGTAYEFLSSDSDYILRSITISNGSSISFWAKPNLLHHNRFIFAKNNTTEQWAFRLWNDNRYQFQSTTGKTVTISAPNLNTDVWNYIVLSVESNGIMNLYLNGIHQGSGNMNGNIVVDTIGSYVFYGPSSFDGSLDNLRLYNRALSVDDIMNLYDAENNY